MPSLRPLLDVYYLPLTNMRIARTFCFTNNGQALYLVSPTEIQRLTYSQETCENLQVNNKNISVVSSEVKYSLRSYLMLVPYTHSSLQMSLHEKIESLYWDFHGICFQTRDKVSSSNSCNKRGFISSNHIFAFQLWQRYRKCDVRFIPTLHVESISIIHIHSKYTF